LRWFGKHVDTGEYASNSEVVREALRQWKARRALQSDAMSELKRLWQEGLDSGAGKPLDIEATKRRAHQRLKDKPNK
jgi:antitoxin ParD1/3/4